MIQDTDNGFRITLDDEHRLRAKARLSWFWKHGNLDMPADWNEEQIRHFIRDYDEECRAWLDAQDAAKAQAQPFPFDESSLAGRPSPGRLVRAVKARPEPAPEVETESPRPKAVNRLAGRD